VVAGVGFEPTKFQRLLKPQTAADEAGFTMGSVAHSKKDTPGRDITARESVTTSRRHRVTTSQRPSRVIMSHSRKRVTTSQNHLWPDPNYGSISAAGMSRNTRHQIRHSGRGTIAHRFTPCRTGCVSHTKDAKNGSAACTSPRRKVEHTSKAALGGFCRRWRRYHGPLIMGGCAGDESGAGIRLWNLGIDGGVLPKSVGSRLRAPRVLNPWPTPAP
jgi:hypothetical protein